MVVNITCFLLTLTCFWVVLHSILIHLSWNMFLFAIQLVFKTRNESSLGNIHLMIILKCQPSEQLIGSHVVLNFKSNHRLDISSSSVLFSILFTVVLMVSYALPSLPVTRFTLSIGFLYLFLVSFEPFFVDGLA